MAYAPLALHLLLLLSPVFAVLAAELPCPRTPGPQSVVARLKEQLLRNYVADEMPPTQGPLAIDHYVDIKQVTAIYYNVADIKITLALTWEDSRLTWDPAQYNNRWLMLIDPSSIWVPNIGIQSHPTSYPDMVDMMQEMCYVSDKGKVVCHVGTIVSAHCLGDYRGWPQDLHNCSFHIGSWMYTSREIFLSHFNIMAYAVMDQDEELSATWVVQQQGYHTTNASIGPDGQARSATHVWLQLAHQEAVMTLSAYSAAVALTVVTLSSLCLPAVCSERLALGAISMLSHCIALFYFSWWLEGGAHAPRVVVFLRDGLCAAGAALLLLVGAGRLQASRRSAPSWLAACLGRLRASPAGALLLPPVAQQPGDKPAEAPAANVTSATDAGEEASGAGGGDADGEGDASGGGTDALVAADASAAAACDVECWGAASVLVERLGKTGVCAALLAALLRLLLKL